MVTVSLSFELPDKVDLDSLEPVILEAARRAAADAIRAACKEYEARVLGARRLPTSVGQDPQDLRTFSSSVAGRVWTIQEGILIRGHEPGRSVFQGGP